MATPHLQTNSARPGGGADAAKTHESGTEGLVRVVCQGSAREMGFAQGAAMKAKVHGARQMLAKLEAFRIEQPSWLPFAIFRRLSERKAWRRMGAALVQEHPEMYERMFGLALGAGIRLDSLCLLNALEAFLSTVKGKVALPGLCACSAIAVRGSRSTAGEPIIARNFDYLPLVQPFYLLRESRPAGGIRSLDFTVAPLAGTVDGINERGLAIAYDYAFTVDEATASTPITMAIGEAMAHASTVEEAADMISARNRWGGGILMLADAAGNIASLELSNTRSHLRRPKDGEDILFHTNAFWTDSMREVQVPPTAFFTDRAPRALRGRRVLESSELRTARLATLLQGPRAYGPEELNAVLSDHGEPAVPGEYTVCVHGSYWRTTATSQLFPKSRRMRVAYSSACTARYQDLAL